MSVKSRKPTTPSSRHTKLLVQQIYNLPGNEGLARTELQRRQKIGKKLHTALGYSAGRNTRGVITMRHKGGRVKRNYRPLDFNRAEFKDVSAEVFLIEYDPNRSANIALLKYSNGRYGYILAPEGLKVGDEVMASDELHRLAPGNAYPLKVIPPATFVHSIELVPGDGARLGRSAGVSIQIQGVAGKGYIQIKLPSGEIRLVKEDCYATIGNVGNSEHSNQKFGKAGRMRKKGVKPTVRGVAQSYKHPHAGGQGKSGRHGTGGPSKDPWGNKRGVITRKRKHTNKFIIKRRTSKLRPRNKPYKTIV